MNSLMSKIYKSSLLSSIGMCILGLLLIFKAELTVTSISYVIGGVLVALGVISLLNYTKSVKEKNNNQLDIVYGIVSIVLGIIVITNSKAIVSIIPFVIGILIIITSATKIEYSFQLKNNKNDKWVITLVLSLLEFFCGILLVFNPFKSAVFVTKVIGSIILVYSIIDLLTTISIKKTIDDTTKILKDSIKEADIVEEKE